MQSLPSIINWLLLGGVVLIGVFVAVWFGAFLFEKEYLAGDLVLKPIDTLEGNRDYLKQRIAEAELLQLVNCGCFYTAPHTSMLKGATQFYRTPDGTVVIAIIDSRMLKKVMLSTLLTSGKVIETGDLSLIPDSTNFTEGVIYYEAHLAKLLREHFRRVQEVGDHPVPVTNNDALSYSERISLERGARMVSMGLAQWANPSQSVIRRTFKGALSTFRRSLAQIPAVEP